MSTPRRPSTRGGAGTGNALHPARRLAELTTMAQARGKDARLRMQLCKTGWSYSPRTNTIRVPERSLREDGVLYCAGVLAHEVAHRLISRYFDLEFSFVTRYSGYSLLNTLEDPRVDGWMCRRYPGCGHWLATVEAKEATMLEKAGDLTGRPAFQVFQIAALEEASMRWQQPTKLAVPPLVVAALDKTRDARRRYAAEAPDPDLLPPLSDLAGLRTILAAEVLPSVLADQIDKVRRANGVEIMVLRSACAAMRIAQAEIFPVVAELLKADPRGSKEAEAFGAMLALAQDQGGGAESGDADEGFLCLEPSPITALILEPRTRPKRQRTSSHRRARLAARAFFRELPSSANTLESARQTYQDALTDVEPLLAQMRNELGRLFEPRLMPRWEHGSKRGIRLHIPSVLKAQWKAQSGDLSSSEQVWSRRIEPKRPDLAVGLLVDLSGSMHGSKADSALRGTVLLAEVLQRIGVPFAVAGFQDELIPFVGYGQRLSEAKKAAIGGMPLEVCGIRPGGHNRPDFNDDAPCLLAFAKGLLGQSKPSRLLIVISDGLPSGSKSSPDELRKVVRHVMRAGVWLVGLGLGPETGHVKDFYPVSRAEVGVTELPQVLGALVRSALGVERR